MKVRRSRNIGRDYAISYISEIKSSIADFIESELKKREVHDLEASHGTILNILYRHEGKLPMKDISEKARRSKSTITQLIDRLSKSGYVKREQSDEDRRVFYIVLTDKAWALKDTFVQISKNVNVVFYNNFSDLEAEMFAKMLEKVLQNFQTR